MVLYCPGDEVEIRAQGSVGGVLILAGQAGVAGDVGVENSGELAL
jgi:hypothetical protein